MEIQGVGAPWVGDVKVETLSKSQKSIDNLNVPGIQTILTGLLQAPLTATPISRAQNVPDSLGNGGS